MILHSMLEQTGIWIGDILIVWTKVAYIIYSIFFIEPAILVEKEFSATVRCTCLSEVYEHHSTTEMESARIKIISTYLMFCK